MCRKTPSFLDEQNKVINDSISEIRYITLGAMDQGILLRGQNTNNPVLLILHGGPGAPHIGHARHFQKELEKHFVVVNWDQRGSGMSYNKAISVESMTLEQFITDAIELIIYLRSQFNNKKIFLIGYSWGSLLGMHLIHRHPEYFHAYFGLSQMANMYENSLQVYNLLTNKAKACANKQALEQLNSIDRDHISAHLLQLQSLSFELGGMHTDLNLTDQLIELCRTSAEYNSTDLANLNECAVYSRNALMGEILQANLMEYIVDVSVPVYFMLGRNDMVLSPYLSEEYFNKIHAPIKKIVWFEHSAHDLMFAENERFQIKIIELALGNNAKAKNS